MDKEQGKKLKFRVRFDYKTPRTFRLFELGRNAKQAATANRRKKVGLLHKIPVKGIEILDVNTDLSVYYGEDKFGRKVIFAPVEVLMTADSLEEAIPFFMLKDFYNVELMRPDEVTLSSWDFEGLIEKMNSEMKAYKATLEIRYGRRVSSYVIKDLPLEKKLRSAAVVPAPASSHKKTLSIEYDLKVIVALSLILAGVILLGGKGWLYYLRVALGLPFV